jgi:hypothetical protein
VQKCLTTESVGEDTGSNDSQQCLVGIKWLWLYLLYDSSWNTSAPCLDSAVASSPTSLEDVVETESTIASEVRGHGALALRASPCKVSPSVLFNPKTCRVYDRILRRRVDDNEQISGSALSGFFSRMFYIVVYVHFALPRTPDACWEAWPNRSNDPDIPRESMRNRLKRDSRTQEAAKSRPRSRARRCTSSEQQLVRVSKLQFGTRLYIESRARGGPCPSSCSRSSITTGPTFEVASLHDLVVLQREI